MPRGAIPNSQLDNQGSLGEGEKGKNGEEQKKDLAGTIAGGPLGAVF